MLEVGNLRTKSQGYALETGNETEAYIFIALAREQFDLPFRQYYVLKMLE